MTTVSTPAHSRTILFVEMMAKLLNILEINVPWRAIITARIKVSFNIQHIIKFSFPNIVDFTTTDEANCKEFSDKEYFSRRRQNQV